jgi:tRNA modification GTPase
VFRDGINLAIVGRPNVGKSSLMNCLLERERAIVTDVPGTTRDLIEDRMQILGIPINVIDTAGLHETDDPIEILGINMARQGIQNAHLILLVIEADRPLNAEDLKIQAALRSKDMILVVNKIDRVQSASAQRVLPEESNGMPLAYVSAISRQGINGLKSMIAQRVSRGGSEVGNHSLIPNLRHKNDLEQCLKSARTVMAGLREKQPTEIIALDIKEALDALDRMTGKTADYELMDQIFSRFCIGK